MSKHRSVIANLLLTLSVFSMLAMLLCAATCQAQTVPVAQEWPKYREALANAKKVRWDNWVSLRDPLLADKKKLLEQLKEKYAAKLKNAGSVAESKAIRREMYVEVDKISAAVQEELDKAIATVNDAFCYNVEQICQQYGEPIPKWLGRFRTK